MTSSRRQSSADEGAAEPLTCNDVRIVGRLTKPASERELPSGDPLVTFVVVVDRPPSTRPRSATAGARPQTVDSLDCVAWTPGTRRKALALRPGDVVEVTGAVRRRFWAAGAVRASRYEVEAATVRRLSRAPGAALG